MQCVHIISQKSQFMLDVKCQKTGYMCENFRGEKSSIGRGGFWKIWPSTLATTLTIVRSKTAGPKPIGTKLITD